MRLSTLLALAAFAWLVWRFQFLCDDAYISFRYARNLADGHGLVFNLGDEPVEGFSNLLWVLLLALGEAVGLGSEILSRCVSVAAGLLLFFSVRAHAGRHGPAEGALAVVFFACLPPLAVWSTGGLATLPFALALFTLFRGLVESETGRLGRAALASCVVAVLLRADGFVWVALLGGLALIQSRLEPDPGLRRRAVRVLTLCVLVFLALTVFRTLYFGDWLPNTARAKVSLGGLPAGLRDDYLRRGAFYVAALLLTFPSVLLALALAAFPSRRRSILPVGVLAGGLLYAVATSGDFMAMGRIVVPALPFAAQALATALARGSRPVAWVLAAAASAASLLPAFDLHAVPGSWRRPFHFRWSAPEMLSEYAKWKDMRDNTEYLAALGRALGEHTGSDERGTFGPVGAVGYFSDHHVFDTYGLTNRLVLQLPLTRTSLASPGHDREVTSAVMRELLPELDLTYLDARLESTDLPLPDVPEGAPVRFETHPAEPAPDGTPRRLVLLRPR